MRCPMAATACKPPWGSSVASTASSACACAVASGPMRETVCETSRRGGVLPSKRPSLRLDDPALSVKMASGMGSGGGVVWHANDEDRAMSMIDDLGRRRSQHPIEPRIAVRPDDHEIHL